MWYRHDKKGRPTLNDFLFFCLKKKRPSSSNLSSQIIIGERFSYIIDQFSSSTIYRDKTKCCCPFELPKPSTTRELFLYWLWFPSFILFKKGTCSRRTKKYESEKCPQMTSLVLYLSSICDKNGALHNE